MKIFFYLSAFGALVGMLILLTFVPQAEAPEVVGKDVATTTDKTISSVTETYFAKIRDDGMVETIIVADQAFIDSGAVGDPSKWIPTDYTEPTKAAVIGGKYEATTETFWTKEQVAKGTTTETVIIKETATSTK